MNTQKKRVYYWVLVLSLSLAFASFNGALAQVDPGVRGGPAGAGDAIPGLAAPEGLFFLAGLGVFQEVDSVQGEAIIPDTDAGLGPRFNGDSCSSCHAQPAVGGTSPFINPQVALATLHGATNTVPFFIAEDGPVREARFKSDGGVHDLYTITGRIDAPGCNIAQPDFLAARAEHNLSFRIPTPLFGAGLIEAISDRAILENKTADAKTKRLLGISGRENRSGNDGTITRFGWKAQNKSLLMFSGEAYNVEQGVTNQLFNHERDDTPECLFNPLPESDLNFEAASPDVVGDIELFATFMRFLAPPTPVTATPSEVRGRALFGEIGCGLCHTPQLTTGDTTVAALNHQPANLYSDILLHNMGIGLADGISQGSAGPAEFRTAPLWGIGQRIFFLHDGRTNDLLKAIREHASIGSEANRVIAKFFLLKTSERQDVLNFLRSL
jgi:CxxC motif-containing protein (DUF1111 family)